MRSSVFVRLFLCCARFFLLVCVLSLPMAGWAQAQWVHFGANGTLVYFADDLTNHLIDYSHAGYEGGGVRLPTNQIVRATVSPIAGDNTANIQNAINTIGSLAADSNGIRGVVLLAPGNYEMDGTLKLNVGGVILRGSGNNTNNGTVLNFFGTPATHLTIGGSSGARPSGSTTYTITNTYVPLGATNFNLNTTSGLSVGMNIIVRRPWTQTWIDAIGMTSFWSPGGHQNDAERTITAINGTQVTVDIELPTPIEQKWVTGTVFPFTDSGRVQQCGVENLCMTSLEGGGTGTSFAFGATGVQFGNCKNCWVHDLAFSGYGPAINTSTSAAKWCTAQDCTYANGVNNGSARPPAFEISSEMCLFQRLTGLSGFEHLCQTSDEATGPNVYLNCGSTGSDFDGGPHRFWAVSLLTDNESGTVGNVHIVIISGGSNGWGAGYSIFYNCHVNNFTIQEPGVDHTYNWWIGGSGRNTNPGTNAAIYDTAGTTIAPNSLYLEQLKERLGGAAVENIGYQMFTLSTFPASQSVSPGSNVSYTVTLGDPASMKNTVTLSAVGLPPGAGAAFSTNTVVGAGHATLTLSTSNSVAAGTYNFNVIGASAGLSHTSAVSVVVGNIVLMPPRFGKVALNGNLLTISGAGGIGGDDYRVLTSTNAALPVNLWPVIATNSFNFDGSFQFTNNLNPNAPQQYYLLQSP